MGIIVTPIPRLTAFGAPAFTLGLTNSAGDSDIAVASNSTLLAYDTTVPATVSTAGATGSAVTSARRDHVHAGNVLSQIVVASRTAAAGAGDQAITGAGFTPTRLICVSYEGGAAAGGWGFADDDLDEYVIFYRSSSTAFSYNAYLINIGSDASNAMTAVVKTYDADGLTLTWSKSGSPGTASFAMLLMR
jgi:hypothetical protein|tara:strand:- start:1055 stop:1624 length:570 start_codon:yes stop_codon:yes gene_type:complete